MANTIKLKRSSVAGKVPALTDASLGELLLNSTDAALYTRQSKDGTDFIVTISNSPILQPAYAITENVILGANRHGLSVSPVEVTASAFVEVPANAIWTIAIF